MLSVQPLRSAQGAADYYHSAFEYYSGDAQSMRWLGKGAEIMGLSGKVEKQDMLDLLEGRLPNGQVLKNAKGEHRPGFDMTFTAPKSISILIGLGIKKLVEFHDLAVERAIKRIEEEFAQTRIVVEGKTYYVNTGNLTVAAIRQPTSRANEPNTHTHGVTMNVTFSEDRKARSLASDMDFNQGVIEQLQKHIKYVGLSAYRTEYANLLKEHFFRLKDVGHGLFELADFPKELIDEFSSRSQNKKEVMEENNWEGARYASIATQLSRPDKEEHDLSVLEADWEARAKHLGFDARSFVENHQEKTKNLESKNLFESIKEKIFHRFYEKVDLAEMKAKEAVFVAVESLAQKQSIFDDKQLKEIALNHTLCGKTIVTVEDIQKSIADAVQNKMLYKAFDVYSKKDVYTTPWLLTMETETLARIKSNQDILKPISTINAVSNFIRHYQEDKKFELTPSQRSTLLNIFTSADRFQAVQGYAGTGKTTFLQLAKQIAEDKGFQLRGLSVTTSAVNELRNKANIHSDVFPIVLNELKNAPSHFLKKHVYVLDEASMLSTHQGFELIKLIEQKGARLLLVGDKAQLSSVECGRIFEQAQDYGIGVAMMEHIVRQRNEQTKASVSDAIRGELHNSLQNLSQVKELGTHQERISKMANLWLMLPSSQREDTLLFAPTHANRRDITRMIRESLKKEGAILVQETELDTLHAKSMEQVKFYHAQYYQAGDVVRSNLNLEKSNVQSGKYYQIGEMTEKDLKKNVVPLIGEDGRHHILHLNELPKYSSRQIASSRFLELYERVSLPISQNDKILITRNHNASGLVNSSVAKVKEISEKEVTLEFQNKELKTFPIGSNELKHIDHGYVLTNMKVQGKDKKNGIGLMESYNENFADLRNYYVQISRAISNMTLITDSKTNLLKALEFNLNDKKTALESVSSQQVKTHQDFFKDNQNSLSIASIMSEKKEFEDGFARNQSIIDAYAKAKQEQKTLVAGYYANQIAKSPEASRLAAIQIGIPNSFRKKASLKPETLRLFKSLNPQELEKAKTVKQYVNLCEQTQKAFSSIKNGNKQELQQQILFKLSSQRNQLAYQIAQNIESHKPFLEHFSIGKLNRFNTPQYQIAKEQEQAISRLGKLGEQAVQYKFEKEARSFFSNTTKDKGSLAFQLKEQSKKTHIFLHHLSRETHQPIEKMWQEINQEARIYQDSKFRENLSEKDKAMFDKLKTYKTISKELYQDFSNTRHLLEKGKDIPSELAQKINTLSVTRNEIAEKISGSNEYHHLMNYFKLDNNVLSKQALTQSKRNHVLSFNQSSNFQEKIRAAKIIGQDIKGYYPLIKELGADTQKLNQILKIADRQDFFNDISKEDKEIYKTVLEYKVLSKQASTAWKHIFKEKGDGIQPNEKSFVQAQTLTAKRDFLAAQLKSGPAHFIAFADCEKLGLAKIDSHAQNHHQRRAKVEKLSAERDGLLTRLSQKESIMHVDEAKKWHQDWSKLTKDVEKVALQNPLFKNALGKHSFELNEAQKTLISRYQLQYPSHSQESLKKPQQSTQVKFKEHVRLDNTIIMESLIANPEQTYRSIFGEPKEVNSKEMRYSGGLIVSLKGPKAGFWYDFGKGIGGNPIQAIMQEKGLSFSEALKEASSISGIGATKFQIVERITAFSHSSEKEEAKNKQLSAQSIVAGGKSLKGTLAETYLKQHRGIQYPERLQMYYWPVGVKWKAFDDKGRLHEKTNQIPALLIPAHNEKGAVTGVQRVYLDKITAKKNTFMSTAKLSKGIIQGSGGIIQKGKKLGTVYLAEGPETAASIAMANPEATVIVSFGVANFKNLGKLIKQQFPQEVVIAADNDLKSKNSAWDTTQKAKESLEKQGLNVRIISPHALKNKQKTDWNDVLQQNGLREVKAQLGLIHEAATIKDGVVSRNREAQHESEQIMNSIEIKNYGDQQKLKTNKEAINISRKINSEWEIG